MCKEKEDQTDNNPSGCIWGQICFGSICAGGPLTIGCENLGSNICNNCAVGLVAHKGIVWDADESARTIFRLRDNSFAEVVKSDTFKPGTLIVQFNKWLPTVAAFVALEHLACDEIEWKYIEPGAVEVTTRTITRL